MADVTLPANPRTQEGRDFLKSPDKAPLEPWVVAIEDAARQIGREEAVRLIGVVDDLLDTFDAATEQYVHKGWPIVKRLRDARAGLNASESPPTDDTFERGRTEGYWQGVHDGQHKSAGDANESGQPPEPCDERRVCQLDAGHSGGHSWDSAGGQP